MISAPVFRCPNRLFCVFVSLLLIERTSFLLECGKSGAWLPFLCFAQICHFTAEEVVVLSVGWSLTHQVLPICEVSFSSAPLRNHLCLAISSLLGDTKHSSVSLQSFYASWGTASSIQSVFSRFQGPSGNTNVQTRNGASVLLEARGRAHIDVFDYVFYALGEPNPGLFLLTQALKDRKPLLAVVAADLTRDNSVVSRDQILTTWLLAVHEEAHILPCYDQFVDSLSCRLSDVSSLDVLAELVVEFVKRKSFKALEV